MLTLIPSRFLPVNTQFFNESFFSIWCTLLTFFSRYDSVIFLLSRVFFPQEIYPLENTVCLEERKESIGAN